ncbi:MAG: hypothetical protein WKG06_22270 [Segetibacter sp.]
MDKKKDSVLRKYYNDPLIISEWDTSKSEWAQNKGDSNINLSNAKRWNDTSNNTEVSRGDSWKDFND